MIIIIIINLLFVIQARVICSETPSWVQVWSIRAANTDKIGALAVSRCTTYQAVPVFGAVINEVLVVLQPLNWGGYRSAD